MLKQRNSITNKHKKPRTSIFLTSISSFCLTFEPIFNLQFLKRNFVKLKRNLTSVSEEESLGNWNFIHNKLANGIIYSKFTPPHVGILFKTNWSIVAPPPNKKHFKNFLQVCIKLLGSLGNTHSLPGGSLDDRSEKGGSFGVKLHKIQSILTFFFQIFMAICKLKKKKS